MLDIKNLWKEVCNTIIGIQGINAVSYSSNKKQTLMSKFSKQYYDFFTEDFIADIENGKYFAPVLSKDAIGHPNTGATKSANAVCNAINVVIEFVWKNNFEGGL